MIRGRQLLRGVLAFAIAAGAVAPLSATTLIRQSLEDLVAHNETVIVGEVVDTSSYWNQDGTFILTDVRIATHEVLKGRVKQKEVTLTVLGGTVGDKSALIVGGAELVRGRSYMLFVSKGELPGGQAAPTVRHHSQGAFDIVMAGNGLRAISQANRHPLQPDIRGQVTPPGGAQGIPLGTLMQSIREIANGPQGSRGVK